MPEFSLYGENFEDLKMTLESIEEIKEVTIGITLRATTCPDGEYLELLKKAVLGLGVFVNCLMEIELPPINIEKSARKVKMLLYELASGNNILKKYSVCGSMVTSPNYFYRCFTCCGSRSGIFCAKCWDPKKHEGHKFTMMYCSGTCDCGDRDSMDGEGMCDEHPGIGDVKQLESSIPLLFKIGAMRQFSTYNFLIAYSVIQSAFDQRWMVVAEVFIKLVTSISEEHSDVIRYLLSCSLANPLFRTDEDGSYIMTEDASVESKSTESMFGMVEIQDVSLIFPNTTELDVETFIDLFGGYSLVQLMCFHMTQFPALYNEEKYGNIFKTESYYHKYMMKMELLLNDIFGKELIAMKTYREKMLKTWTVVIPRLAINQYISPLNPVVGETYCGFSRSVMELDNLVVGNTHNEESFLAASKDLESLEGLSEFVPFTSCGYQVMVDGGYKFVLSEHDNLIMTVYMTEYLKTLLISKPSTDDGALAIETRKILRDCVVSGPLTKSVDRGTINTILKNSTKLIYTVDELQPLFTVKVENGFINKALCNNNISLIGELMRKDCYRNRIFLDLPDVLTIMSLHLLCYYNSSSFGRIKEGLHIDEIDCKESVEIDFLGTWRFWKYARLDTYGIVNGYKATEDADVERRVMNFKPVVALIRMWLASKDALFLFSATDSTRSDDKLSDFTHVVNSFVEGFDGDFLLPLPFGDHCIGSLHKSEPSKMSPDRYTFNIPLHRLFVILAFSLARYKHVTLEDILSFIGLNFFGRVNDDECATGPSESMDEGEYSEVSKLVKVSPVVALSQHPLRALFAGTCFKLFLRNGQRFFGDINYYFWIGTRGFTFGPMESDYYLIQGLCSMQRKRAQVELAHMIIRTFGLEDWLSTAEVIPVDNTVPGSTEAPDMFHEILVNALLVVGRVFSNRLQISKTSSRKSICEQSVVDRLCYSIRPCEISFYKQLFPAKYRSGDYIDDFLDEVSTRVEQVESGFTKCFLEPNNEAWRRSGIFSLSFHSSNMEQFITKSFEANKDFPLSIYSLPEHSFFPDKLGVDPLNLILCTGPVVLLLSKTVYAEASGLDLPYLTTFLVTIALILVVGYKNVSEAIPSNIKDSELHDEGFIRFEEALDKPIPFTNHEGKEPVTLRQSLEKLYKETKKEEHKLLVMFILGIPKPVPTPEVIPPQSPFSKTYIKEYDMICPVCLDNTDDEMTLCADAKITRLLPFHEDDSISKGLILTFCQHSYHFSCVDQCLKEGNNHCSLCNKKMNFSVPFSPANYVAFTSKNSDLNQERMERVKYIRESITGVIYQGTREQAKSDSQNENMISDETLVLAAKLVYYDDFLFDNVNEMVTFDSSVTKYHGVADLPIDSLKEETLCSVEHVLLVLVASFILNLKYQEQLVRPWELNVYKTPSLFAGVNELNEPKNINRHPSHLIQKEIDALKECVPGITALVCFVNHIRDIVDNFGEFRYLKGSTIKCVPESIMGSGIDMAAIVLLSLTGYSESVGECIYNNEISFQLRVVLALVHFFSISCPPGSQYVTTCKQLRKLEESLGDYLEEFKRKNLEMNNQSLQDVSEILNALNDTDEGETMDKGTPTRDLIVSLKENSGIGLAYPPTFTRGFVKYLIPRRSYDFVTVVQDRCVCDLCGSKPVKGEPSKINFLLCLSCGKVVCTKCPKIRKQLPQISFLFPDRAAKEKQRNKLLRCASAVACHCATENKYCTGTFLCLTFSPGMILQQQTGFDCGDIGSARMQIIHRPQNNHSMYVDSRGSINYGGIKYCFMLYAVGYDGGEELKAKLKEQEVQRKMKTLQGDKDDKGDNSEEVVDKEAPTCSGEEIGASGKQPVIDEPNLLPEDLLSHQGIYDA